MDLFYTSIEFEIQVEEATYCIINSNESFGCLYGLNF